MKKYRLWPFDLFWALSVVTGWWLMDARGGFVGALMFGVAAAFSEWRGRRWMLNNPDRHWTGARYIARADEGSKP